MAGPIWPIALALASPWASYGGGQRPFVRNLLRDARGGRFVVELRAKDEKRWRNDTIWSGAEIGDRMARGTYRFWLKPARGGAWSLQEEWPAEPREEMDFNLRRKMAYVVRRTGPRQPDLLVVEQHAGSNGNDARAFIVRNGRLRGITFAISDEPTGKSAYWIHGSFRSTGPFAYTSEDYNNSTKSPNRNSIRTWRLLPRAARMVQVRVTHPRYR